jgi:hypothetical protein
MMILNMVIIFNIYIHIDDWLNNTRGTINLS